MKKFYEAPVVELNGFSAEDVITTSVTISTINMSQAEADLFVARANNAGFSVVNEYGSGSYEW